MNWTSINDTPEFSMIAPDGTTLVTRFASAELNYMTRWILYNGDQQVAAFAPLRDLSA